MEPISLSAASLNLSSANPLEIHGFSSLCKAIQHETSVPNADLFTEKIIYSFVSSLRRYMDEIYGKKGIRRQFTILPTAIFNDLSENGALYHLLILAINWTKDRNIELQSIFAMDPDIILELLRSIETSLLSRGFLVRPVIYLGNSISTERKNMLKDIISRHNGVIADTESNATHLLEWNEEVDDAALKGNRTEEDFIRVIDSKYDGLKGNIALIHWWYHPDSFDRWIAANDMDISETFDLTKGQLMTGSKWKLSCRFVLDCEVFNEWGNELDYEIEVDFEEMPNPAIDENEVGKKSRRRKKNTAVELKTSITYETISVTEKVKVDMLPFSMSNNATSLINVVDSDGAIVKSSAAGIIGEKRKASSINNIDEVPSKKVFGGINQPSESFLSDLIKNSKLENNPNYSRVREEILTLANNSPDQYLTATQCRRVIAGDVALIFKVHELLENELLINKNNRKGPNVREIIIENANYELKQQHTNHSVWSIEEETDLKRSITTLAATNNDIDSISFWLKVVEMMKNPSKFTAKQAKSRFLEMTIPPPQSFALSKLLNTSSSLYGMKNENEVTNNRTEELEMLKIEQNKLINSILAIKVAIVEEKVNLLRNVESIIEIERAGLESNRRDHHIIRAYNSLTTNTNTTNSMSQAMQL
eukprot:gene8842-11933_t